MLFRSETTGERLDLGQFQVLAATSNNEAYNALVCSEFAPLFGRDSVYQLGDGCDADPRSLPEALRGRAMFHSGLGVEQIIDRDLAGWTFRKTRVSEKFNFQDMLASLPEHADVLLLKRKGGKLLFFTHASEPVPEPGDVVLSYAPPRPADEAQLGKQVDAA